MSEQIAQFVAGLEDHHASGSITTAAEFEDALRAAVEGSTVGVPLDNLRLHYGNVDVTVEPTPRELSMAHTGVTPARLGIADSGSILVTSGRDGTEAVGLYPPRHVAVLPESALVPDVSAAITALDTMLGGQTTSAVLATGPSATADMGSLVYGAHGPREVHVLVVTDR